MNTPTEFVGQYQFQAKYMKNLADYINENYNIVAFKKNSSESVSIEEVLQSYIKPLE